MMSADEKLLRRQARVAGWHARASMNRAMNPVYDGDEVMWTDAAVRYARTASRLAAMSIELAELARADRRRDRRAPRGRRATGGGSRGDLRKA